MDEFDIVLDAGVSETQFNVAQMVSNAANAVKDGGYVLHFNAASRINYGFWNFNPKVYWNFYRTNGFQIEGIWWVKGESVVLASPKDGGKCAADVSLMCVARRVGRIPIEWPKLEDDWQPSQMVITPACAPLLVTGFTAQT